MVRSLLLLLVLLVVAGYACEYVDLALESRGAATLLTARAGSPPRSIKLYVDFASVAVEREAVQLWSLETLAARSRSFDRLYDADHLELGASRTYVHFGQASAQELAFAETPLRLLPGSEDSLETYMSGTDGILRLGCGSPLRRVWPYIELSIAHIILARTARFAPIDTMLVESRLCADGACDTRLLYVDDEGALRDVYRVVLLPHYGVPGHALPADAAALAVPLYQTRQVDELLRADGRGSRDVGRDTFDLPTVDFVAHPLEHARILRVDASHYIAERGGSGRRQNLADPAAPAPGPVTLGERIRRTYTLYIEREACALVQQIISRQVPFWNLLTIVARSRACTRVRVYVFLRAHARARARAGHRHCGVVVAHV